MKPLFSPRGVMLAALVGIALTFGRDTVAQDRKAPLEIIRDGFGKGAFRLNPGNTPPLQLQLTRFVPPDYPAEAMSEVLGQVLVDAVIGSEGVVRDARVAKPLSPALDRSALAAVKKWRFGPSRYTDTWLSRPVMAMLTVNVNSRRSSDSPQDVWAAAVSDAHRFNEAGLVRPLQVQVVRPGGPPTRGTGRVLLEVIVQPTGRVGAVRVVRPSNRTDFDELAINAATQCVYTASVLAGQAVAVIINIEYSYTVG
jgi:TonB family protein